MTHQPSVTPLTRIPVEIVGLVFTNIERAIMERMGDGEPYILSELKFYDPMVEDQTIQTHIQNIRRKIATSHYRIHSGYEQGRLVYRVVRILPMGSGIKRFPLE